MRQKNEAVTVSFHYLVREFRTEQGKTITKYFSNEEFDGLVKAIEHAPTIDLADEDSKDSLRFRDVVPIEKLVRIDDRTLFGVYKASYWGHAYENSDRGTIPAESISLRPFHFLLYLAESGRIYLASQYLGQFGGYTGLYRTVASKLPNSQTVQAHSFRLGAPSYKDASAKEVKISISKKGGEITSRNVFQQGAMIAFKKRDKNDGFEDEVSKRIFPFIGRPAKEVQQAIASILNENELMDVADEDIADCTVVATVNGKRKVIHMLENGLFATRFPIDVPLNKDGHPEYETTKQAILKALRDQVIARKEDV